MAMPRTGMRVVCTLGVTMATLEPTSALISVDLPALGAPMMAQKPQACGHGCIHLRQQFRGRVLFGFALGAALARHGVKARHRDFDHKARRMVGAFASDQWYRPARRTSLPRPCAHSCSRVLASRMSCAQSRRTWPVQ